MKKIYMRPDMEMTMLTPLVLMTSSLVLNRSGQDEDEVYDEDVLLSRSWSDIWEEEERE